MRVIDLPNVNTNLEFALFLAFIGSFVLIGLLILVHNVKRIRRLRRLPLDSDAEKREVRRALSERTNFIVSAIFVVGLGSLGVYLVLREGFIQISCDEQRVCLSYRLWPNDVDIPREKLRRISVTRLPFRRGHRRRGRKPGWVITVSTVDGRKFKSVAVAADDKEQLDKVVSQVRGVAPR